MDLEEFYSADERRRRSAELEFGRDWHDDAGRFEVSWVEDTGEVYTMREPSPGVFGDTFGDMRVGAISERQLGVEIVGTVVGRDAIEAVMHGWRDAMLDPAGAAWLRDRVRHAAEHLADAPAAPSEELPED
jgi:hypothetical protein